MRAVARSYSAKFLDLFGPPRPAYEPIDVETAEGRLFADCAASDSASILAFARPFSATPPPKHRSGRPLRRGAFDLVYSSGVVHHTPDPRASFGRIAELACPGGLVVLGVYNAIARIPSRLRRVAARLSRDRFIPFDPVLRDRAQDPARRDAWVRDQYRHPEEHRHTIAEVQRWFADHRVEYLRTYPGTVFGDTPEDLFTPAPDNWPLERWLAQIAWMGTLGREGGMFFTIGRRR